jgi:hypothetical protein
MRSNSRTKIIPLADDDKAVSRNICSCDDEIRSGAAAVTPS